jgi:hypothetical protein
VVRPGYDIYRAGWCTTCKNALVVFEEIPPRRAPRSQRFYIFNFAFVSALFPVLLAITWPLWPHPLSHEGRLVLGGFAFFSLLSGTLLLNAKSVTPRDNQERLWYLLSAAILVPRNFAIFSLVLR